MKFFKNHTGILSALIVGVAIISSAFLLTQEDKASFAERAVASPSSALREQVTEKDSDGDGLLDWEETLWGTDPFVVDTDGDGILDGEFVANRKKDKTPEEIIDFEDLSFTSQFSRTFFAEYLRYQNDGELTESEKDILISRLANSASVELPKNFAPGKVETVTLTDSTLANYFTTLAILVQEATPSDVTESELTLLEEGLEEGSAQKLSSIKKVADGYSNLSLSLENVSVPESLREQHADLITATARLGVIIEGFSRALDDAVYALAVLPEYEVEVNRMNASFEAIYSEVEVREIIKNEHVQTAARVLGL